MNQTAILTLFDYNYWANSLVVYESAQLAPDQLAAPYPVSHASLLGSLVHIYAAEYVWRQRCQNGISPSVLPAEADFPSLDALRRAWAEEELAMRFYLEGLDDQALNQKIRYQTTKGVAQENILWQLLAHLVNHGTQFRAEAAVALTAYGRSPGDLDLLRYLRETA